MFMGVLPLAPIGLPVVIYIDGFNLYYGALKSTAFKWLDINRLFTQLRPHDQINAIRYFTAVSSYGNSQDQLTYLRALATLPRVTVIQGRYKKKRVKCGVIHASCTVQPPDRLFFTPEEKRTDVNIGIFMLDDAYQGLYEHAILVSGDSDLVPAVNMIRTRFPNKQVTVYVPSRNPVRGAAVELRAAATKNRDLPLNLLPKAQFPGSVADGSGGQIVKPRSW